MTQDMDLTIKKGHPICQCTWPKLKTKQLVQDSLDDLSLEGGELHLGKPPSSVNKIQINASFGIKALSLLPKIKHLGEVS